MFVLVEFGDGVHYVCAKEKVVWVQGFDCIVKYHNGSRYNAKLIAENADRRTLENLKNEKNEEPNAASENGAAIQQMETVRPSNSCDVENEAGPDTTYTVCADESITSVASSSLKNDTITLMKILDEFETDPGMYPHQSSFAISEISADTLTEDCFNTCVDANSLNQALKEPILFSTPNSNETHVSFVAGIDFERNDDIGDSATNEDQSNEISEYRKETASPQPQSTLSSPKGSNYTDFDKSDVDDVDYQPTASDSECNSEEIDANEAVDNSGSRRNSRKRLSENSSLEVSLSANMPGKSTRDDGDMFVCAAAGKKALDRRSYCMYCHTMQSKLVRHLENKHKDVKEVNQFAILPKGNPERLRMIDAIRKKCMFDFNTNNTVNDGELLVCRRPSANLPRPASHFVACQNCKGFFSKSNIRHHAKRCFSYDGKKSRTLLMLSRKMLGRIHQEACEVLRKDIFPILREDDIVRLIRYDRLIILYGNKLCAKYGGLQHQHDMIRATLRLLGRFLNTMRSINAEVTDFASICQPKMYDDALLAIQQIAGYDSKTKKYASPSTAYSIGSLLKKVSNYYIFDCIKREDTQQKSRIEDFLKLLNEDIGTSVNKAVMESQTLQNRRKKVELPSMDDIRKLHEYLKKKRDSALRTLNENFDSKAWLNLSESTLISIQLFNRRRAGEIERVSIEDFKNYECVRNDELKNMSKESQDIAKKYVRFTIRGKLNRTVPVLLSADLFECVETILKHRKKAGVAEKNPFVFGIPQTDTIRQKYLRACTVLRKFAIKSGVSFPHKLTGTTLRKHVATACINLNLSENEVSDVARFMGHADKIHREHYRQPIVSREIMRMSKILEHAQVNPQGENETDSETEIEEENTAVGQQLTHRAHVRAGYDENKDGCSSKVKATCSANIPSGKNEWSSSESNENTPKSKKRSAKKRSTSPYGVVKRKKRWSVQEKQVAWELFGKYIRSGTYASLKHIQEKCAHHPILQNRSPCVIKTWMSNEIKKKKSII